MELQQEKRQFPWLATLLILWNIIDIAVHVAIDLPEPFEGVRYTAPGPPDLEPVIIALDDPMRVSRAAP